MTARDLFNATLDADRFAGTSSYYGKVKSALRKYQIAHCYHPVKLKVMVGITGEFRDINVPCGKCPHCLNTKRNEWVTRAYAHSESFRNVYFVTLTYRSFYPSSLSSFAPHRILFDYLGDAGWIKDSFNKLHRDCYSPSVLVKKHYQDFLKRLRKNTGLTDITYMVCGEYGHEYGRPHFHLVLFTNGVITAADVSRAWSLSLSCDKFGNYKLSRNSHLPKRYYSFGKVSFDDLVKNGSFDEQHIIRVDGKQLFARNCFAYVCKYLNKNEYNYKRVETAYRRFSLSDEIALLNRNKQPTLFDKYEKFSFFRLLACPSFESFDEFRQFFRPFFRVSLGTPIGSNFVKSHLSEMAEGKFTCPALQTKGYVLPSYFLRKVSEFLFPYRKISVSSSSSSFVKQNVPLQSLTLQKSLSNHDFVLLGVESSVLHDVDYLLRKSSFAFVNVCTRRRSLIQYDIFGNVWSSEYSYDRKTRSWVHFADVPIEEFVRDYFTAFVSEYERYIQLQNKSDTNNSYYDAARVMISSYLDFDELVYNVVESLEKDAKRVLKEYNVQHNHLE